MVALEKTPLFSDVAASASGRQAERPGNTRDAVITRECDGLL